MTTPEVTWNGNMTPHPIAPGGTVAESGLANMNVELSKPAIEAALSMGQFITAKHVELTQ